MALLSVGDLCLKKDKKGYYLKLSKDVEITVKGKKLVGEYLNVDTPKEVLERILKAGKITPEKYEEEVASYAPGGNREFVRQRITGSDTEYVKK